MYLCELVSSMFRKKSFLPVFSRQNFPGPDSGRERRSSRRTRTRPQSHYTVRQRPVPGKRGTQKNYDVERERERENIFLVKDLHFPSCSLVLSTPNFNLNLQCCLCKVYLVCINFFFVFLCQYFGHGIGCSEGNKAHSDGVTNYVTNEAKVGERGRRNSAK